MLTKKGTISAIVPTSLALVLLVHFLPHDESVSPIFLF